LLAQKVAGLLKAANFGPFYGTPCGILAPLYRELEAAAQLTTISREDNAVGMAAGAALCGRAPVVLMQNSGFGHSINALASLVIPYQTAMLLIISLRGTGQDGTAENQVMGRVTPHILDALGMPAQLLDSSNPVTSIDWARSEVLGRKNPSALLIEPGAFGWMP
jgi:sulfopyruvate decarboxylase subunit alpha